MPRRVLQRARSLSLLEAFLSNLPFVCLCLLGHNVLEGVRTEAACLLAFSPFFSVFLTTSSARAWPVFRFLYRWIKKKGKKKKYNRPAEKIVGCFF